VTGSTRVGPKGQDGIRTNETGRFAVVIPIGPGKDEALDTLDSVDQFCSEPHIVVLVDDCTQDGTYEALCAKKRPNWYILRNSQPLGVLRLVHTLSAAYRFVLANTECDLVLRLDQDALLIGPEVLSDAAVYASKNPLIGLFGVYAHDYDRPRSFTEHTRQINRELRWHRKLMGLAPAWEQLLFTAEKFGYRRGDNVFGGAYFITRGCLASMDRAGALTVPFNWHSSLMEDVYFSMAAVGAGHRLGHFAAPDGPLSLEWRGLPYPANECVRLGYKIVHSVDKGKNTDRQSNGNRTAREVFRELRTLSYLNSPRGE
jgi:hypothetical protein